MQNGIIMNEVNLKAGITTSSPRSNLNDHSTQIWNNYKRPTRELSYEEYGIKIAPVENFYKGPEATKRTTISV